MNRELAEKVAQAVLYEGYMLYPYRSSAVKNRQRWSFGILYPPAYGEVLSGTERSAMHSECLLQSKGGAQVQVELRCLHLLTRQVEQQVEGRFEPSLMVEGHPIAAGEEGVERTVEMKVRVSADLYRQLPFEFPGGTSAEPLRDTAGNLLGTITRKQHALTGTISLVAEKLSQELVKLTIDVFNTTGPANNVKDRNEALLRSMISAHTILSVTSGEFVSLLDPPEELQEAVRSCKNVGNFPVLIGAEGERDMLLCSPIVLYDYPQIAPESAGDFYDATEMDEMLTLRVLTLTDDEKNDMRSGDDHMREMLQRTEQSARDQLMKTHGTIRNMRPVIEK